MGILRFFRYADFLRAATYEENKNYIWGAWAPSNLSLGEKVLSANSYFGLKKCQGLSQVMSIVNLRFDIF